MENPNRSVRAVLSERRLADAATVAAAQDALRGADAVLSAVSWGGVEETLRRVGADEGALADVPVIDPTNTVEHGVGVLLTEPGASGAQRIGTSAPEVRVVKAFRLSDSRESLEECGGRIDDRRPLW
ncbi:hypothetical protein [Nocardia brevicatena]|uniref:hypothetical protein n=1 Tax=Nocardia brevicatena TaxID=37327 RepID=UPI00030C15FA|nr:hypothetical protein [Nocardia brevicatena]